jgi:signal transduction histidine kinase
VRAEEEVTIATEVEALTRRVAAMAEERFTVGVLRHGRAITLALALILGIAEDDREQIFERFYRGKTTRNRSEGFGLGLALSREIIRASGGELSFVNRDGGGTEFCIELPSSGRQTVSSFEPPSCRSGES